MTDTKSLEGTGEPVVSFNMNEATGLYGHWQQIDELQEQYSHFWTTFAYGYWVLTEPEAIREAFQRSDLFSSSSEVASEPDPKYTSSDQHRPARARQVPPHLEPPFLAGSGREAGRPDRSNSCRSIISGSWTAGRATQSPSRLRLPTRVFMSSLGLPVEDTPIFVARVGEIFANLRDPAMSDKLVAALASIRAYFSDALEDRRSAPRDPEDRLL